MTISVISTPSTPFTIPPNQALVVENLGPGYVHWGRFAVDDSHNEGIIQPSNTITFFAPFGPQIFLACDTPTQVNTSFIPFPQAAAMLGTDGTLGGPSGSPLSPSVVSGGSGPASANQALIASSAGSNAASWSSAVEVVPDAAVQYIFQARNYGIKADAVVDQYGNLVSGTDDTTAWTNLIAALPADKAVIKLHGMSLISNSGAFSSSVSLLFNTNDLTILGEGPHTGFVLAHGANCNALRFNNSATNTGPPRIQRVHLENFTVDHQGFYQAEPGSGVVGAIVAYACSNFTTKSVRVLRAKSTSINAVACQEIDMDQPFIDTVIPGGAANGINIIGSATAQSRLIKVHDGHFIDVPDKALDAGGIGAGKATVSGNTVEVRNMRPATAGITGNPFIGFQAAGTTAAAWSNGTNYSVGNFVSNGGFNYVALVASGPGNGGAVTPGTNNLVWWLQNAPLVWNSGTSYVVGQCVYYTAGTGHTGQVEGGTTCNFTCISASTNNPPVDGSGNVDSHWQIGGPLTGSGRSVGTIGAETTPNPTTRDVTITGNVINGQNLGGEYVVGVGIQISSSKSFPGVSMRNGTVSGNVLRGIFATAILANDENFAVVGNTIEDCTNGIQVGFGLSFAQRQWLVANNTIKLGGTGGGTGILIQKGVSGFTVSNGLCEGNVIDGGMGPDMELSSALTNTVQYTSIPVAHVPVALPTGTVVLVGKLPQGGGNIIAATLSSPAAVGDTSLTVTQITANATYNAGTNVQILVGTITGTLSSGVPITSIGCTALAQPLQLGTVVAIPNATGSQPLLATLSTAAAVGATTLSITSVTPSTTYNSGQPIGVWGANGIAVAGSVTLSTLANNIVACCAIWGYQYFVSTGTPSNIDQTGCWSINCAGHTTVGSTIPGIRLLNGGWNGCTTAGSYTGTAANYVLRRGVQNINPAGSQTPPAFPATGVNVTNQSGFDITVFVANSTGAITQIQVGGTNTNMQIAASTWGSFKLPAGQTCNFTYASGTPAWTWFAD